MVPLYMIHGDHQFPQFNGAVVQAEEADPFEHANGQLEMLYKTIPVMLNGNQEIYWFRRFLFPLQDFPAEQLEHHDEGVPV